ncbi:aminotransferase [Acetobacter oeni]|uniref:Aminotransferase n=1 Tax=Acetobacter oeni TaxID=304077 RepID=A0A511XLL9_9PROT|nr:aminotransferase [Acetobacter oeni]MBB3884291.1 aspartate/methionine/tyrosine aminotransferase [Acetobacter oeni]NHO20261.1 aminotransferase [Acetobacter oeni]GBR07689.1 transaminase [Acetobacter oeni LMG 21952]GEN63847.1 aminotransferase [Acetobacter oeni]
MKPLNQQIASLPTTIFTVMSALAARHDAINLGQGFPDTEGPAHLIEAAAAALRDGRNQYAPLAGLPELREAVARSCARFYSLTIDPATEVVVTSGATEAIAVSLAALVNPGDEIIVIEPAYDTYLPVIRLLGAVPRLVRLTPPDWSVPREDLAAAFSPKTKAILLNSPMNPCGKVFTPGELGFIAGLVQKHDAYAICDEVYEHLTFGVRHIPLMTLPGMRERCLRIGSAGKSFSLTGWKVGYITAPAPLAAVVAKAHQNLVFATAPNLQRAVAVGLDQDTAYFTILAQDMMLRRDILAAGLREIGFGVLPCDGTYFLTADISSLGSVVQPGESDQDWCKRMTAEAGVALIPVSAFYDTAGSKPPTHLVRFAFCKKPLVLEEALTRLRDRVGRG